MKGRYSPPSPFAQASMQSSVVRAYVDIAAKALGGQEEAAKLLQTETGLSFMRLLARVDLGAEEKKTLDPRPGSFAAYAKEHPKLKNFGQLVRVLTRVSQLLVESEKSKDGPFTRLQLETLNQKLQQVLGDFIRRRNQSPSPEAENKKKP